MSDFSETDGSSYNGETISTCSVCKSKLTRQEWIVKYNNVITLCSWTVFLNSKLKVYVKGAFSPPCFEESIEAISLGPIRRRYSNIQVASENMLLNLKGPPELAQMPPFVAAKFAGGFPENWREVIQEWRKQVFIDLAGRYEEGMKNVTQSVDNRAVHSSHEDMDENLSTDVGSFNGSVLGDETAGQRLSPKVGEGVRNNEERHSDSKVQKSCARTERMGRKSNKSESISRRAGEQVTSLEKVKKSENLTAQSKSGLEREEDQVRPAGSTINQHDAVVGRMYPSVPALPIPYCRMQPRIILKRIDGGLNNVKPSKELDNDHRNMENSLPRFERHDTVEGTLTRKRKMSGDAPLNSLPKDLEKTKTGSFEKTGQQKAKACNSEHWFIARRLRESEKMDAVERWLDSITHLPELNSCSARDPRNLVTSTPVNKVSSVNMRSEGNFVVSDISPIASTCGIDTDQVPLRGSNLLQMERNNNVTFPVCLNTTEGGDRSDKGKVLRTNTNKNGTVVDDTDDIRRKLEHVPLEKRSSERNKEQLSPSTFLAKSHAKTYNRNLQGSVNAKRDCPTMLPDSNKVSSEGRNENGTPKRDKSLSCNTRENVGPGVSNSFVGVGEPMLKADFSKTVQETAFETLSSSAVQVSGEQHSQDIFKKPGLLPGRKQMSSDANKRKALSPDGQTAKKKRVVHLDKWCLIRAEDSMLKLQGLLLQKNSSKSGCILTTSPVISCSDDGVLLTSGGRQYLLHGEMYDPGREVPSTVKELLLPLQWKQPVMWEKVQQAYVGRVEVGDFSRFLPTPSSIVQGTQASKTCPIFPCQQNKDDVRANYTRLGIAGQDDEITAKKRIAHNFSLPGISEAVPNKALLLDRSVNSRAGHATSATDFKGSKAKRDARKTRKSPSKDFPVNKSTKNSNPRDDKVPSGTKEPHRRAEIEVEHERSCKESRRMSQSSSKEVASVVKENDGAVWDSGMETLSKSSVFVTQQEAEANRPEQLPHSEMHSNISAVKKVPGTRRGRDEQALPSVLSACRLVPLGTVDVENEGKNRLQKGKKENYHDKGKYDHATEANTNGETSIEREMVEEDDQANVKQVAELQRHTRNLLKHQLQPPHGSGGILKAGTPVTKRHTQGKTSIEREVEEEDQAYVKQVGKLQQHTRDLLKRQLQPAHGSDVVLKAGTPVTRRQIITAGDVSPDMEDNLSDSESFISELPEQRTSLNESMGEMRTDFSISNSSCVVPRNTHLLQVLSITEDSVNGTSTSLKKSLHTGTLDVEDSDEWSDRAVLVTPQETEVHRPKQHPHGEMHSNISAAKKVAGASHGRDEQTVPGIISACRLVPIGTVDVEIEGQNQLQKDKKEICHNKGKDDHSPAEINTHGETSTESEVEEENDQADVTLVTKSQQQTKDLLKRQLQPSRGSDVILKAASPVTKRHTQGETEMEVEEEEDQANVKQVANSQRQTRDMLKRQLLPPSGSAVILKAATPVTKRAKFTARHASPDMEGDNLNESESTCATVELQEQRTSLHESRREMRTDFSISDSSCVAPRNTHLLQALPVMQDSENEKSPSTSPKRSLHTVTLVVEDSDEWSDNDSCRSLDKAKSNGNCVQKGMKTRRASASHRSRPRKPNQCGEVKNRTVTSVIKNRKGSAARLPKGLEMQKSCSKIHQQQLSHDCEDSFESSLDKLVDIVEDCKNRKQVQNKISVAPQDSQKLESGKSVNGREQSNRVQTRRGRFKDIQCTPEEMKANNRFEQYSAVDNDDVEDEDDEEYSKKWSEEFRSKGSENKHGRQCQRETILKEDSNGKKRCLRPRAQMQRTSRKASNLHDHPEASDGEVSIATSGSSLCIIKRSNQFRNVSAKVKITENNLNEEQMPDLLELRRSHQSKTVHKQTPMKKARRGGLHKTVQEQIIVPDLLTPHQARPCKTVREHLAMNQAIEQLQKAAIDSDDPLGGLGLDVSDLPRKMWDYRLLLHGPSSGANSGMSTPPTNYIAEEFCQSEEIRSNVSTPSLLSWQPNEKDRVRYLQRQRSWKTKQAKSTKTIRQPKEVPGLEDMNYAVLREEEEEEEDSGDSFSNVSN